MSDYILELKDIVKRFSGVVALNHVQFQLKKGEIHALMGENGAGKSTFIKVITGVHAPDEGEIILKGEKVTFANPREAYAHSIAAIYQHSTAYPHLTVAENIFVGHYKKNRLGLNDWPAMYAETRTLLESLGSSIDPRAEIGMLTVAEQQIVEIAKAISQKAEILIMDEPTAALSEKECEQLYQIADRLRDQGTSIIFISHRIEDMYRLATRVTVFRDSQYIGTYDVQGLPKDKLVAAMVGREVVSLYPKRKVEIGEEILRAEGRQCRCVTTGRVKNEEKGHKQLGSMMALSGTIMGLVGNAGGNFLEVALAGLLTGTLCGFFNGFLITRFTELSSTIITLANQIFFRGIALVILENRAYAEFPAGVKFMSWGSVFNVPFILVFFLLEVIGITYLVHFTTFGRSLFAMGRNIKASYYSGVKTDQIKIAVFTMNGMAASISSLFLISKLASARANMAKNYDMDIIAMVILGGVSVSGGKGSVIGTAIAVFIIGLLRYGLGLINVSSETLMIIVGCLLIVLVAIPNLKTLGNEFPHLAKLFARKKQRKA